jgi:hypothetical protein
VAKAKEKKKKNNLMCVWHAGITAKAFGQQTQSVLHDKNSHCPKALMGQVLNCLFAT